MQELPPPRIVTLVLVNGHGDVLGALPPLQAATPWWMDIAPVVHAAHAQFGVALTVLRLLSAQPAAPHGGAVTYVAQVDGVAAGTPLSRWHGALPDDPKRLAYACVGGPQADLAWAVKALQVDGDALSGAPQQIRTWNLSSIWRLPTRRGGAWLKVVPPFFAHEGAMLARLADAPVPRLIGHDGARLLLAPIPGQDAYGADLPLRLAMVDLLVELQHHWRGRADTLLPLGLPDWQGPALAAALAALIERRSDAVAPADRAVLDAFVRGLPARFAALADCGLAATLVHGDFHPGNLRSDGGALTLLDWGDCGVGHPLLDLPAFLDATPPAERQATQDHWFAAWARVQPGTDPRRAAPLLAPLATARKALIYQRFLDGIEAAEHPYHRADVPEFLRRTAERVRAEPGR